MAQQLLQQFFFQLLQPGQQAQSRSPSSQPDSSSSQPDSSSSQVVTDDPSTWPRDTNSNLVAPSSLTTLPDDIGSYITGDITGIDLSATQITTIGNGAFLFCENLQTVTLPNSVGTIGSGAFWDCSNLTKINLEDTGITEILNDTFTSCERLATVILPSKLTSIGYGAFQSCTGLTHLYFTSGEVPEIAKNSEIGIVTVGAFRGVDANKNNLTIHYPNSWGNDNLQKLKDEIKESGMENVNINGNTPKFESYTTLPTLSLLDAARLFGL